MDGIFLYF